MVRQITDHNDGEVSELFPVTNGVKLHCVLAPILLSTMLTDACQDSENDISMMTSLLVCYRSNINNCFRGRRLLK